MCGIFVLAEVAKSNVEICVEFVEFASGSEVETNTCDLGGHARRY